MVPKQLASALFAAAIFTCPQLIRADFLVTSSAGNIFGIDADRAPNLISSALPNPWGFAVDTASNLFVSDIQSNSIYRISPAGVQSVVATNFVRPQALLFDSNSNLYVADNGANLIVIIHPDGSRTNFASGLQQPCGMAFDRSGNLFVGIAQAIVKISPDGTQSTFADGMDTPFGVAFDAAGNLFCADYLGKTIYKFDTNGARTVFADNQGAPTGLLFDSAGNLYDADNGGTIYKFAPDGSQTAVATGLDHPVYMAFLPWTTALPPIFTTIAGFANTNGANPKGGLIQASDGNIYGTTYAGGVANFGTIFRVTRDGTLSTLYSFTNGIDGASPYAGLFQAVDGALYGTAYSGGSNGLGTVYKITTNGDFTVVTSFAGDNGANPTGRLTQSPAGGNLYGTTYAGGPGDAGTVFALGADGTITPLWRFSGSDGLHPYAGLAYGYDGNLYGTCSDGGPNGFGTIFGASTTGGMQILYPLSGGYDGGNPFGELWPTPDGNLYGSTYIGGGGWGADFELVPPNNVWFGNDIAGYSPRSGVIVASDGNLYGTCEAGGNLNYGTVYRLNLNNAIIVPIHTFTGGTDGASPVANVLQASNGDLWGTTPSGGANGFGTIFRIQLATQLAPLIQSISATNGSVTLTWAAAVGQYYQLQSQSTVDAPWQNVGGITTAANSALTISIQSAANQSFYRVLLLP